jgi:uncharacterized protein (TIGR00369 family)
MTDVQRLVRESFARQTIMKTLGASLALVEKGRVQIELPYAEHICQQHGFLHAGVLSTIVDSACGYAGLTMMPEGSEVLTTEFKINLLSPAKGERFIAVGRVIKSGRTLTVAQGEITAVEGEKLNVIAIMTATLIRIDPRLS